MKNILNFSLFYEISLATASTTALIRRCLWLLKNVATCLFFSGHRKSSLYRGFAKWRRPIVLRNPRVISTEGSHLAFMPNLRNPYRILQLHDDEKLYSSSILTIVSCLSVVLSRRVVRNS